MPSTQHIEPLRHSRSMTAAVERLVSQKALERLFRKDPSLWTDEASAHPAILNRLGWLSVPSVMSQRAGELTAFASSIRKALFTHAVLLGMGGSSLFAEVLCRIFGASAGGLSMQVLDSTDPAAVLAAAGQAPAANTLALVSSKSGTTSEVSALTQYFFEQFRKAGVSPGDHCIAITDSGTPLEALAQAQRFRNSFILDGALGRDVGGRFSALTYFGLVPAALMGLDVARLLEAGLGMLKTCGPGAAASQNPALALGTFIGALSQEGRNKLTFLCPEPLTAFGIWAEQLVAESTGKSGKGTLPVVGEPLWGVDGYGQDRLFVELQWKASPDAAIRKQAQALAKAGHPVAQIAWNDRYDLAEEVVKWCLATAIAGIVLRVNPFDEPNVWETKDQTKVILGDFSRDRRLGQEKASCAQADVAVFDPSPDGSGSVQERVQAFMRRANDGDFFAILSFLPQIPESVVFLERLARLLGRGGRLATVVQIGPRYLHSTGQLHKGGFDGGLFLVLTGDDPQDAEIPGEAFSFSVLKRAQALGDFEALRKKGRRLLRVHLGGTFAVTSGRFLQLVEAATHIN
jgi:glucose-6-phosphate isomerase